MKDLGACRKRNQGLCFVHHSFTEFILLTLIFAKSKRYPVFVVDRINHFKYPYYSKFYRQCNPYHNFSDISNRNKRNNPKIHMEPQKTLNCQRNLAGGEQNWRYHPSRLKAILQSYRIKTA